MLRAPCVGQACMFHAQCVCKFKGLLKVHTTGAQGVHKAFAKRARSVRKVCQLTPSTKSEFLEHIAFEGLTTRDVPVVSTGTSFGFKVALCVET